MKTISFLMTSIVASIAIAGPDMSLVGDYDFVNYECASGEPAVDILNRGIMEAKLSGSMSIQEKTMTTIMKIEFKADEEYSKFAIEMMREQLSKAQQLPDSDEAKAEMIAELETQIKEMEKMAQFQTCHMNAEFSYSLAGDLLSSKTTSSTATCEGFALDDLETVDVQKVVIDGVLLKLQNTDQGKNKDKDTCPTEGDHTVLVFKRK